MKIPAALLITTITITAATTTTNQFHKNALL